MTNNILDGVSIKLNKLFGNDYELYTNSIKQGFKTPCFFIKTLPGNKKKLIGNRYENTINLVIHAMLDDSSNKTEQLNDIADKLYELEYIKLLNNDILKGYDMKTEINDGVLLFFVTYKYFTYKVIQKETEMENIDIQGGIISEK